MKNLKGKHALVTGASRGIGVRIAKALAERGMNLTLVARSAEGLRRVKAELEVLGVKANALPADIGKLDSLPGLVVQAQDALGPVDLLVNNAGLESIGPYQELELDEVDNIITVNLMAPMHLTHLLMPGMISRGHGHILNVASLAGLAGIAFGEPYSATKHGLVGFTRSLRASAQAAGHPIGSSVVCPGFISEVGMYADMVGESGIAAPDSFGTSTPEQVTAACLKAVDNDLAEVLVNSKPIRPLLLLNLVSPSSAAWLADKMGAFAWSRELTEARLSSRPPRTPRRN
jgi:short-subunit dehydrogenase